MGVYSVGEFVSAVLFCDVLCVSTLVFGLFVFVCLLVFVCWSLCLMLVAICTTILILADVVLSPFHIVSVDDIAAVAHEALQIVCCN